MPKLKTVVSAMALSIYRIGTSRGSNLRGVNIALVSGHLSEKGIESFALPAT